MKRNTILLCCLLSLLNCFSQKIKDRNFLDLSIGASFPVGNYANKNIHNDLSGFAKNGEFVSISYGYKTGSYFGISAMIYCQRNPIGTRALGREFSETKFSTGFFIGTSNPGQPVPPGAFTIYPNWKFEKSSWLSGSALVGGFWEIPFYNIKKLSLITKAMAGVIYVSSPKLIGNSFTDSTTARIEQNRVSAFGISYLLRGELKYNFSSKINIHLNIDYLSTNNITFHDVKTSFFATKNINGQPSSAMMAVSTADGNQTIQAINPGAGIGIRF